MEIWFPFEWSITPTYELITAFQFVVVLLSATNFAIADASIFGMCYAVVGQFKILECKYRNVLYTALSKYGCKLEEVERFRKNFNGLQKWHLTNNNFMKNESRILQIINTENFDKLLDKTLNECIEHHIGLLSICKGLVSYYSPLALFKVAFITMYLALNTALLAANSGGLWIGWLIFLTAAFAEIFFWCISGQLLLSESDELLKSVYECPWYLCSNTFKKKLLIIQMRSSIPVRLTAQKVMLLSLENLVIMLKHAFSYYTLMKKLG